MPWGPARFSRFLTSLFQPLYGSVKQSISTQLHRIHQSISLKLKGGLETRMGWKTGWQTPRFFGDGCGPLKNYHKHNHHGKPIDFASQFNAPATSAKMVQLKPTSLRLMPVACQLLKSCAPNKMFHKKLGSCDICEPITTTSTTSYSLWPSNPATPSLL